MSKTDQEKFDTDSLLTDPVPLEKPEQNPALVPEVEPEETHNPALVREPDPSQGEKKYKVPDSLDARIVDPQDGLHWPGDEFVATFSPEQEARLIERGQLEVIDKSEED